MAFGDEARDVSQAKRAAIKAQRKDTFLDAIADGMKIPQAAEVAGISRSAGDKYMKEVRDYYGWQAE